MSIEMLALAAQLNQNPDISKLPENPTPIVKIASIQRPTTPSFIKESRQEILNEIMPDSGFIPIPKVETPEFRFDRNSSIEPIGIKSKNGRCSGTIFKQKIDGVLTETVITISHCLKGKYKILLGENIQVLTDLKLNYEGADMLDPVIAIPLKAFEQLGEEISIISLSEYIPADIRKLMESFKTSSNCDISKPTNFYNTNIITLEEDPNHPQAFQEGQGATVSQAGQSGSTTTVEGIDENGKVCLNPKMVTSHGKSGIFDISPGMIIPNNPVDYIPPTYSHKNFLPGAYIKRPRLTTTIIKSAGFIDTSSREGKIITADYALQNQIQRSFIPVEKQAENSQIARSSLQSTTLRMDGKIFKIERNQDKTKKDIITELPPEKINKPSLQ